MPNPKKPLKPTAPAGWTVSVIGTRPAASADPTFIDLPRGSFAVAGTQADSKGNVLFVDAEEVQRNRFEEGFSNCMALASSIVDNSTLRKLSLELEGITLKLSVNAKYGCSLIADARLAGGIEVKLKRKHALK